MRRPESGGKATVLIVEDEALPRLDAAEFIEEAGFEVLEAQSADEAIRILESRTDIRIVFTDVDMPGLMDGVKLAHAIRGRWPPIKLIVASSYTHLSEDDLPSGSRFFVKAYRHGEVLHPPPVRALAGCLNPMLCQARPLRSCCSTLFKPRETTLRPSPDLEAVITTRVEADVSAPMFPRAEQRHRK